MIVLSNVPVVEICDAHIQNDIQQESEIEDGKIDSITFGTNYVLNFAVYSQYPKRFDEQIQEKQESKISDKFFSHKKSSRRL